METRAGSPRARTTHASSLRKLAEGPTSRPTTASAPSSMPAVRPLPGPRPAAPEIDLPPDDPIVTGRYTPTYPRDGSLAQWPAGSIPKIQVAPPQPSPEIEAAWNNFGSKARAALGTLYPPDQIPWYDSYAPMIGYGTLGLGLLSAGGLAYHGRKMKREIASADAAARRVANAAAWRRRASIAAAAGGGLGLMALDRAYSQPRAAGSTTNKTASEATESGVMALQKVAMRFLTETIPDMVTNNPTTAAAVIGTPLLGGLLAHRAISRMNAKSMEQLRQAIRTPTRVVY